MLVRIEEWMKSICIEHKCKYYDHRDYPYCSICTCPGDNCILLNRQKESDEYKE
jgi:hypothetical protein